LRSLSGDDATRLLADRVRLLDATADPGDPLASSDLLVGCSRRHLDPAPVSLGRCFGLPVVLSDVPGVEEYARPGRDALLYEPGDVPALRGWIEQILDLPGVGSRLAAALRLDGGVPPSPGAMVRSYERLSLEAVAVGSGRAA